MKALWKRAAEKVSLCLPEHWKWIAGVAAGAAGLALILNLVQGDAWGVILSSVSALAAVLLTVVITINQGVEAEELKILVKSTNDAVFNIGTGVKQLEQGGWALEQSLRRIEEAVAKAVFGQAVTVDISEGLEGGVREAELAVHNPGDLFVKDAIVALKGAGADLDFENLRWERKMPESGKPGNYGWFVRSLGDTSGARWFVRKANGISVRKAMPQDFLDALRERAGISPKSIQHDFQLKEHGLAAWYARTYSGNLYRVWRPNRSGGKDIQVELVESE